MSKIFNLRILAPIIATGLLACSSPKDSSETLNKQSPVETPQPQSTLSIAKESPQAPQSESGSQKIADPNIDKIIKCNKKAALFSIDKGLVSGTKEKRMTAYVNARKFYDTQTIPSFLHPVHVREYRDMLIDQLVRFRKTHPDLSLEEEETEKEINSTLELNSSLIAGITREAFVLLERCETASAIRAVIEYDFLPARGISVQESGFEFSRFEASDTAVFYLTETRKFLGFSPTATLRYIVKFRKDQSDQWWLVSCKLVSF